MGKAQKVTDRGVAKRSGLETYISIPIITSVKRTLTTSSCGECTTVTDVTIDTTTDDILVPIVMKDNVGRAHIILSQANPTAPEGYETD